MRAYFLIAGGVVATVCLMFVMAFGAEIYSQLRAGGIYVPSKDLVDILRWVMFASVTILGIGGIVQYRQIALGRLDSLEDDNHGHEEIDTKE